MPGILNVGNSYSPNNKKITSKLTFDVGEKFSGKIIKSDSNEIVIKLTDGWEFSAVVEGDISDLKNVLQRFVVEGYENGKLRLKIINKTSGDEEVSKDFTSIIDKEGLKGNDKELLEAMVKFNISLTKENIREIKGIVQFLDKIKNNPKEIEEFIAKYLEVKGIDINSELGKRFENTLREFFNTFKGLTKEDILLFIENGVEFNKENIDSYNNLFKENSSINDLIKEFENAKVLKKEMNTIKENSINIKDISTNSNNIDKNEVVSNNNFVKDAYQKTDINSGKISMLSLLKSMSGKNEDIINVTLKEVLNSRRNSFTTSDFERVFNNINNTDSSEIVEKLILNINQKLVMENNIQIDNPNKNFEKSSHEKLQTNDKLDFNKGQLGKILSDIMGREISLNNNEFEKLKDAINLKYNNMIEESSAKGEVLGYEKNINNQENLNNVTEKESILPKDIASNNIDKLKNGNTIEDKNEKSLNTKEVVQQSITKTGENNKEIIKDVLSALESKEDVSEKILNIVKNNINDIKVFNKFSGDYYYANLPINIKERDYPCKLIVKDNRKEGKKIDSKNVKMVITVDTKNLGVIDGYMNVNDRNIEIDLKCEEKSVKIIDMTKEKLINNIESMGFSVKVKVYKKLEEVSLTTCRDFFNTGSKVSLDRRV